MSAGLGRGWPLAALAEPVHHRSHVSLLGHRGDPLPPGSPDRLDRIDAVIVPAHRPVAHLENAARAATDLGAGLVVLCSDALSADSALGQVQGFIAPGRVRAVDVRLGRGRELLPTVPLATDAPRFLDGLGSVAHGDVSAKRNLGLLIARAMGWRAVLFLDDDVRSFGFGFGGTRALGARRARRVLDLLNRRTSGRTVQAVGWRCSWFYDNSVVCHAYRDSGHFQDVFIGGGGLAVRVGDETPFFPNVYNEDWLFLHPLLATRSVRLAGNLHQDTIDPYQPELRQPYRQEFGDVLAEGLFRLLHAGQHGRLEWEQLLRPAVQNRWWAVTIERRHQLLDVIAAAAAHRNRGPEITRVVIEARSRLGQFEPHHFAAWVTLWIEDQTRWTQTLAGVRSRRRSLDDLGEVLRPYGLAGAVRPG